MKEQQRTIQDCLDEWVADGSPDKILKDLLQAQFNHVDRDKSIEAIQEALDAAAEQGTQHLIELAFKQMMRFTLSLTFRIEYLAGRKLQQWDDQLANRSGDIPPGLNEKILPALERLHRHVLDISRGFASIRHVLAIADAPKSKTRSENKPSEVGRNTPQPFTEELEVA